MRYDFCLEAIRLVEIIADHTVIKQKSNVYALLALIILNASRFEARQDAVKELVELANQKRELWNREMIKKGIKYLDASTGYGTVSQYHILAAISAHHCTATSHKDTDWKSILALYDNLLQIDDTAIIILNRAVAVCNVYGVQQAIDELKKLENDPLLQNYHYYYFTLGELFFLQDKLSEALKNFDKALVLIENKLEIELLHKKINRCKTSH